MSSLSNLPGKKILTGYWQLELPPAFDPVAILLDRKEAEGYNKVKLKNSDSDVEIRKGVYILAATERNSLGKYNVTVGQSGVDGQRQILIQRVKHHASNPPVGMEKWDKAILLCDWENDILAGAKSSSKKKSNASKASKEVLIQIMKTEVHLLESMLHSELKKYDDEIGSLSVERNEGGLIEFMPNPDLRRYEYYVECAMRILEDIAPDFMKPSKNKKMQKIQRMQIEDYLVKGLLSEGEKVFGRFDSKGTILDLEGNVRIDEFTIMNKKAKKNEIDKLSNLSLFKAAAHIRNANKASGSVSAPDFWYVSRNDEQIQIKDLRKL